MFPYEGRQGKAASCSIYMLLRFSLRQLSHSEAVGVTHQVLFVIQCAPHRSHRQLRVLPADLDKENHHRAQQDGHQDGQKDCKDHSWGRERGSASGAGKGSGFAFTKAGEPPCFPHGWQGNWYGLGLLIQKERFSTKGLREGNMHMMGSPPGLERLWQHNEGVLDWPAAPQENRCGALVPAAPRTTLPRYPRKPRPLLD